MILIIIMIMIAMMTMATMTKMAAMKIKPNMKSFSEDEHIVLYDDIYHCKIGLIGFKDFKGVKGSPLSELATDV